MIRFSLLGDLTAIKKNLKISVQLNILVNVDGTEHSSESKLSRNAGFPLIQVSLAVEQ